MSKTAVDHYRVSRTTASLALNVSWRKMQSWVMHGMPVQQRGAQGKAWVFDLEAVIIWAVRHRLLRKPVSLPCEKCGTWRHNLRPHGPIKEFDHARIVCKPCRELDDEL